MDTHTFVVSTTSHIISRGTTGTDLSTGTARTPHQLATGIADQHKNDYAQQVIWVHLWEGVTPERDMPARVWEIPSRSVSFMFSNSNPGGTLDRDREFFDF